jgi:hypothetical protein
LKKSLPFKQFEYAAAVFLISRCCGLGERIILHIDLIKGKFEIGAIIFHLTPTLGKRQGNGYYS